MTVELDDETLSAAIKYCSSLKMCGQRPNNVLEAIAARLIIGLTNGENHVKITKITVNLITGELSSL